jgi:YjbE family integral membrane protein
LLSIIIIDIVLAGDNSIIIAMAVQSLPKEQRFKGILFGAVAAVFLRVIFTFFATHLLTISFVKMIGGLVIFWVAVKLLVGGTEDNKRQKKAQSVWGAIWMIMVADLTMSLDNILAVAGASHGNFGLLLLGLGLSIPLVIFASAVISKFMERFRIVIWIGALIIGKVAGEMIVTDPWVVGNVLAGINLADFKNNSAMASHTVVWSAEIIGVCTVFLLSILLKSKKSKKGTP